MGGWSGRMDEGWLVLEGRVGGWVGVVRGVRRGEGRGGGEVGAWGRWDGVGEGAFVVDGWLDGWMGARWVDCRLQFAAHLVDGCRGVSGSFAVFACCC